MTQIIRNTPQGAQLVANQWTVITLAEGDDAASIALPEGQILVPRAVWEAQAAQLAQRPAGSTGVWLEGSDEPVDVSNAALVAIHFPKFADGRGYSLAYLLRNRQGYRGELRAFGDVGRDQLNYLSRSGFDSFALRDTETPETAIRSLQDFTEPYQGTAYDARPLWQRVARG